MTPMFTLSGLLGTSIKLPGVLNEETGMTKSLRSGGTAIKPPRARRKRPVTMMFRTPREVVATSVKAMIDGGLARLLATYIATKISKDRRPYRP
jgi:hypothetical protein